MSMEFNASYNERIANLASHDQQHDFKLIDDYIIQHTNVTDPQFELRQWIRAKSLDRPGFQQWLMAQAGEYGRLDDSLFTR